MSASSSALQRTLGALWRWSLFVTVPIVAVFGLWIFRTTTKYLDLGLQYHALGDEMRLHRVAEFEGRTLLRDVQLGLQLESQKPKRLLKRVDLYLSVAAETALNSDLPYSGRDYVKGSLGYPDGGMGEVKVRYRGDHYWHWACRKKSLRVKTKKDHLFEGMRSFNLIAPKLPEQFSGYLSYYLADQFDLITPRAEMVDVFVNGDYRGVHLLLEQLEEMVVRQHRRMPGDIYSADVVRDDRYRGLPPLAFENPGLWEKAAVNNHFGSAADAPLRALLRLVQQPASRERSLALRKLVDIDAFGRFAAFRTLCQSEHYDDIHNWRLYYDPWKNRFEPIVWDPVGWGILWRPRLDRRARPDIVSSALDRALMQDHAFLDARQRAMEGFFAEKGDEQFLDELDRLTAQTAPSFETDPGLAEKLKYMTAADVDLAIVVYQYFVRMIFDQLREDYLAEPGFTFTEGAAGRNGLRIALDGRRSLTAITLDLDSAPDFLLDATLRFQDGTGSLQERDITGALTQENAEVRVDVFLASQLVPDPARPITQGISPPLRTMPGVYEIQLSPRKGAVPARDSASLPGIRGVRGQFASGQSIRARHRPTIAAAPFATVSAVASDLPVREPRIWEGLRTCQGVVRIEEDVIVRPGTVFAMEPGASLIFEGRLLAAGTANQPIVVRAASSGGEPWGTFALRGPGANASELSHVAFSSGSGLIRPLEEFSAMLSLHDVQDISVTSCTFRDNHVVDDMVHAVYSTVRFEACTFTNALSDALDLDVTSGTVLRCQFENSGNDALDLMTSDILVEDSTMSGSGDKGVSVGENTQLMLVQSTVKDCLIGIQLKDRSKAIVYNCDFIGNGQGIDAIRKNWRYGGGGVGYIYKSVLAANQVTLHADKHSRIRLHDCLTDREITPDRSILLDATSEIGESRTARLPSLHRFPEEREENEPPVFTGVWRRVDPLVRGRKPQQ